MSRGLGMKRELNALLFAALLFVGIGYVNPAFLTARNIALTLQGSVMYIFLAIGMTFVILTGDIDVSVGAVLGMSAAVAATLVRDGYPVPVVIGGALLVGLGAGLLNGVGVTMLRIPAIVMTLGTMGVLRGAMFIYTNGKWVENLPDFFKHACQAHVSGVNLFVAAAVVITILMQAYLSASRRGRYFAAIGDNLDGAVLVGIPVSRYRIITFVLSGLCSAVAGLVYTSQIGFVGNVAGAGTEMTAIAACVIGGVGLAGGTGSVAGAFIGAVVMNTINTALVFLRVPAYWNNTISGLLLLTMVLGDSLLHRYMEEKARRKRLEARFLRATDGRSADD
ncbi:MAG: ABC transporter permease [Synergistota bacterium]|jgi:AI-2 transport system permease protein|nr:ABC transporter permease [Synergistota bacterium]